MVRLALFPTAVGPCGIAWRGDAVVATHLPDARPEDTARRLAARTGGREGAPPPAIRDAIATIAALLRGEGADLDAVLVDMEGVDPFAARVYAAARAVPPGATTTYGAIAAGLGDRHLARAVGRALGRNPLPILVPCHRVLGAGGRLTGFSAAGGVALKLRMLAAEGARVGGAPGLFADLPMRVGPR